MAKFIPIKTIESKVNTIAVEEGKFIFCTDTGNIYIDAAYGSTTVVRRQGFPKHIRQPVELILEAGSQSGLDMIGDVNDPILNNTIVFVKEVEAYFYFDAESTETPNGETIIKPEYVTSGAGRWKGFTTHGITPHIDEITGNWFRGTEDTGKPSRGPQGFTPTVGDNENWHVNDEDTGKPSRGPQGFTPEIGQNENWHIDGTDTGKPSRGLQGHTPEIGQNDNWFVNNQDTGKSSRGLQGHTPTIGDNDNWIINGQDTGKPSRGISPTIHPTTKHWMSGETDTGVIAEGKDGTGFNFRGLFDHQADPPYKVEGNMRDTVNYEGALWAYVGATPSTNTPPLLPVRSNAYWSLVLEEGIGAGGSRYYIDDIESLNFIAQRTNALYIVVGGKEDYMGVYNIIDTSASSTNRKWVKVTSSDSGIMLRYNTYSNRWELSEAMYMEEYGWEIIGYKSIQSETNPVGDPWNLTGWTEPDDMGMGGDTPMDVSMIRLTDIEEDIDGLAGLGSEDDPILNGVKCYVTDTSSFFIYDAMANMPEDNVMVIRPNYVKKTGYGRWVKYSVVNSLDESDSNKIQIVSRKKYIDAVVYVPFDGHLNCVGSYKPAGSLNGFIRNAETYVPGKFNKALELDGWGHFDIPYGATLIDKRFKNFTISIWVKFSTTNNRGILSGVNYTIRMMNRRLKLEVKRGYNSYVSTEHPDTMYADVWYHVACVHYDNTTTIYLNGSPAPSLENVQTSVDIDDGGVKGTGVYGICPNINEEFGTVDTAWVEELCIWDKVLYKGPFTPPTNSLDNTYYPVNTPQLVPNDLIKFNSIGTDLQLKAPFAIHHRAFKSTTATSYKFKPDVRYNTMCDANVLMFPEGFTPGLVEKTIIAEYKYDDGRNGLCIDPTYLLNDYTGDNAKTPNMVNIYEIKSNGARSNMKFTVTKLGEYAPRYNLYYGDEGIALPDIQNPESANVFNDTDFIIDGYFNGHDFKNLYMGVVDPPDYQYRLNMNASVSAPEFVMRGNTVTQGTFFKDTWDKVLLGFNAHYNMGVIGLKDRALVMYRYGTTIVMDDTKNWKTAIMCSNETYTSNASLYAITEDGELYYFEEIMNYNLEFSKDLIDNTKTWEGFSVDIINGWAGPQYNNFIALADGQLFAIMVTDNTILEVDSALKDVVIITNGSNVNGTYNKVSNSLYSRADGNYHIVLIDKPEWTSWHNRWVIANTYDFSNITDEWEMEGTVTAKKADTGGTPFEGSWEGSYGMPFNITISRGNGGWKKAIGIPGDAGSNPNVLALKTDGSLHYLKWDDGDMVSAPIEIDGVPSTATDWKIKCEVNDCVLKGTTLHQIDWGGEKPIINSSNAQQKVVNYLGKYRSGGGSFGKIFYIKDETL